MTKKQLSYADAIAEIEQIIEKIETDQLDVDQLTVSVKRVSELLAFCKHKLKSTEDEVKNILKDFEE